MSAAFIEPTTLTARNVRYLKHAGDLMDIKVTCKVEDKIVRLYMRADFVFFGFKEAQRYLQHVAQTEFTDVVESPEEVRS